MATDRGTILLQWTFPEFPPYDRSIPAMALLALVAAGLIFWAVSSQNYLLAFLVALVSLVVVLRHIHGPETMQIHIREDGIELGHRTHILLNDEATTFIPWENLDRFWMIYKPPRVKKLYLHHASAWTPLTSIDLADQDPVEVRRVMGGYLTEDLLEVEEPFTDVIARWMRL